MKLQYDELSIHQFMDEHKELMDDLIKLEEFDKSTYKTQD